jgi:tetratricopeptide (TPR) repeat protein
MSGRKDQHDPGGRTEPRLGNLDGWDKPQVQAPPPRDELPHFGVDPDRRRHGTPPREPKPGKRGWLLPVLLLVVIGVVAFAWTEQDRLRGLVPSTELNDVLGRADQALHDGHLDGNDGKSARELYEAARALEPDNDRARDGLRQVGQAEIARADAAVRDGKLDDATQALNAARELLGGGSDVERLDQQIAKARSANVQPDGLIERAQQALADGHLDGDEGAGNLYRQVLAIDPNNAIALHGMDKVADGLAAQARKAIDAGDRNAAAAIVDKLAVLLPNYGDLPALRAALVQAQKQDTGELADDLKQGQDALRAGRIDGEGEDTALAYFKSALAIDPDNAEAKAGLGQVAQALIVQANAAIDANDSAHATQLLERAASFAPKSADLAAARARLGDLTRRANANTNLAATPAGEDGDVGQATQTQLTPQQSAQIARMLQNADLAARRGQVMLPPGDSAYDLYRGALAIDGNNEAARRGLQELPNLVSRQFNQAMSNGNLVQAEGFLGDLSDLAPGDAGQDQLRQRLAGAWMDQAEQQLGRGDRTGAAQSLNHAGKLSSGNPRLQQLQARLSTGR